MSERNRQGLTRYSELYMAAWQAWDERRHDSLSRRRQQWRVVGDFMWAAFCAQWPQVAWAMLVGKE